jgi:hypothetical protein
MFATTNLTLVNRNEIVNGNGKEVTELGIRISDFGIEKILAFKLFLNSEFRIPNSRSHLAP